MAAVACEPSPRTVDVCGRGDRDDLAALMAGGWLEISVRDAEDSEISSARVDAAGERVELDFDGGRRVRVTGFSGGGQTVAAGEAALGGGGACVCFALAWQSGACAGVVCRVEAGACSFYDAESGEPAGSRELALDAVADATITAALPDATHGDEASVRAQANAEIALVRFDTTALPRTAVIEEAFLELTLLPPPAETFGIPVAVHALLEPWEEADATWNQRAAGEPWSAPGCGPGMCDASPWAALDPDRPAERHLVPLGTRVGGWVADPQSNHGLALVGAGGTAAFWSREGSGVGAAPPRLVVRYHMADDPLPPPTPGPICGNGLVEPGESCDDGDRDDADACTNACAPARCGDGIVRAGVEECDDANDDNGDGCTTRCLDCADANAGATFAGADGRCYARFDTPRNYGVAENSCDEAGHGTLVVFDTLEEQQAVLVGLGIEASATLLWIGLSDRGTEGGFVWADGSAPSFTSFATGEPDAPPAGNGEDCVAIASSLWNDRSCSENRGYVCERAGWSIDADGTAYLPVLGPTIDWEGARLECIALGAHLAVPASMGEHARVAALATQQVWIGLSERALPGTLAWVTGEPVVYTGFPSPPALDGDSFCAQIDGDDDWSVAPCAARRRYVCEAE